MPAHFTLYAHRGPGPNPLKNAILLEHLGLSYDVIALDFGHDPEKGVKGAALMKICPNGRVPALVDHQNNDLVVWESGAILYYLVDKYDTQGEYFGRTPEERAETMIWVTHQLSGLGPVQGTLNYVQRFWEEAYGEKASKGLETRFDTELNRLYKLLDDRFGQQKYVGLKDRVTIADFSYYPWVTNAPFGGIDISKYPNAREWQQRMAADEKVKAADARLPKTWEGIGMVDKKV